MRFGQVGATINIKIKFALAAMSNENKAETCILRLILMEPVTL